MDEPWQLTTFEREALARVAVADEALVAARSLLHRIDEKYLLPRSALSALFASTAGLARMPGPLDASPYVSRYYDSDDLRFFHDHRRGRRRRFKVRQRHYLDRRLTAMEVKSAGRRGATVKKVQAMPFGLETLRDEDWRFVAESMGGLAQPLRHSMTTRYGRLTLLGVEYDERLTLDLGLSMSWNGQTASFAGAVIAEVKQARAWARSPATLALRRLGAQAGSLSKYCVGVMALRPEERAHQLRPRLRALVAVNAEGDSPGLS